MQFPNNPGMPTVPHKNPALSSSLMDGMMDGLTDDYKGSADKISVIFIHQGAETEREGERQRQ